jgi:predicted nucleic acid-binding protein
VAETAVVNASPVIFLSRAGLIDLLQLISAEVIVPESVAQKLRFEVSRDPAPQSLANTSWVVVTQYLQSQLKSKPWD